MVIFPYRVSGFHLRVLQYVCIILINANAFWSLERLVVKMPCQRGVSRAFRFAYCHILASTGKFGGFGLFGGRLILPGVCTVIFAPLRSCVCVPDVSEPHWHLWVRGAILRFYQVSLALLEFFEGF